MIEWNTFQNMYFLQLYKELQKHKSESSQFYLFIYFKQIRIL